MPSFWDTLPAKFPWVSAGDASPFDVAAERTRRSVTSRKEGAPTRVLEALGSIPSHMAQQAQGLVEGAAQHPPGMSLRENPALADLAAANAFNVLGMGGTIPGKVMPAALGQNGGNRLTWAIEDAMKPAPRPAAPPVTRAELPGADIAPRAPEFLNQRQPGNSTLPEVGLEMTRAPGEYAITRGDTKLGDLSVMRESPDRMFIGWAGADDLGTSGARQVQRALQERYPDVKTFAGVRKNEAGGWSPHEVSVGKPVDPRPMLQDQLRGLESEAGSRGLLNILKKYGIALSPAGLVPPSADAPYFPGQ